MNMKKLALASILVMFFGCFFAEAQSAITSRSLEKAAQSIAVVLVGDGEGEVIKIGPAVAIRADGILLVPYHIVKEAREVQVRLKSGEIFDDVVLLGADERRDVAAIKIPSTDLAVLTPLNFDELKIGEPVHLFTHLPGKLWAQAAGKLTRAGLADEMPGAGQGFRIVQFEGAVNSGTDGAILVDSNGIPIGLSTKDIGSNQKTGFAVPLSTVVSLGDKERARSFGSGRSLSIPISEAAFRASRNPNDPLNLLLKSKTVYVETKTTFFKEAQLINELNKRKEIKEWGWILTTGSWDARNKADLIIELDHQILTFDFTFTLRHRKSSVLISAGKAIIVDGASGAPKMVDKIIKSVSEILNPPAPKGE